MSSATGVRQNQKRTFLSLMFLFLLFGNYKCDVEADTNM